MQLSSEKVPHMTLLFLGEQNEPAKAARISEYIEHVTETMLRPFGMSVFRRGELGPDRADVLFFDDEFSKSIFEFRDNLLKNDDIASSVNSTFQYPKWTPHLTMGYPETPSKKLPPGEYPPTWIEFDRIAFWVDDYDGPEYVIPRPKLSSMTESDSMAMQDRSEAFLSHYGVKGMKWGKRKSASSESSDKESRKEYKTRVKKERDEFYNKKLSAIVEKSVSGGDNVLIKTMYGGDTYGTVTTGSEFVKQLSTGRAFNAPLTEVYAIKTGDGPYQLTGDNNVYQKSKRRK